MLIICPAAAAPDGSGPGSRQGLADGAIIQLAGTPRLWVAKGDALHWVGATSALAGRTVHWESRRSGWGPSGHAQLVRRRGQPGCGRSML